MSNPVVAEIHARANEHSKVRAVRALVGDVRTGLRVRVGMSTSNFPGHS